MHRQLQLAVRCISRGHLRAEPDVDQPNNKDVASRSQYWEVGAPRYLAVADDEEVEARDRHRPSVVAAPALGGAEKLAADEIRVTDFLLPLFTPTPDAARACLLAALLVHAIAAGAFHHGAPRLRPAPIEALRPRSSSALRVETSTPTNRNVVPPGVLGPPEPLRSLRVGQSVTAFRSLQYDEDAARLQFTIERVSCSPGIFHLRSFLTDSECEHIILAAKSIGMEAAGTVTNNDDTSRKKCSVAWIPSNQQDGSIIGGIVSDLVSSTVNIFLSPEVRSHPSASAGVEDLQVLEPEYGTGGEFVYHHDGEPRILTVIYYVNGVAGTWFPLAQTNDGAANASNESAPKNKGQALEMADGLQPGKDGLLARSGNPPSRDEESNNGHVAWIERGVAVAFYNYKDDGSGRLDWRALHCGLPTAEEEGPKWIANHWYRLNALADVE